MLEENNSGWCRVQCAWDGYEGWCCRSMLHPVGGQEARQAGSAIVTHPKSYLLLDDATEVLMPPGALLWGLRGGTVQIGPVQGCFKGRREKLTHLVAAPGQPVDNALLYREAPYIWGGRTPTGIDCSGLVQMAFKLCGQAVPRDAWQQAEIGETVDFLQHAQRGDVAFFDNEEGRIIHVGLLLDNSHILHATESSGRTVIDRIDGEGIISVQLRKRTHRLRLIRRFGGNELSVSGNGVQGALF